MLKKIFYITCLALLANSAPAQSIVRTDSFYSPSVQLKLKYTIILPSDYYKSKKYYPVVYLLHGHTGNYTSWLTYAQLPVQLATTYNTIIVLPDGGNSWYVNWTGQADGRPHKWEDMLIKDLLPEIETKWHVVKNRKARTIGGLSMGGYGALAIGLKNARLFGFVFSSAGAIDFCRNIKAEFEKDTIDWNSPQLWSNGSKVIDAPLFSTQKERTPKGLVFKTSVDADKYDPYILLEKTDTALLPFIHLDCGNQDDFLNDAYRFVERLKSKTTRYSFIILPGAHEVPYWKQAIEHTFLVMHQKAEETDQ